MIWVKSSRLGKLICWLQQDHFWHHENEYSCCLSCGKFVNQMVCSKCKEMFGYVTRCENLDQNRLIPLCTNHCGHG